MLVQMISGRAASLNEAGHVFTKSMLLCFFLLSIGILFQTVKQFLQLVQE